MEKLPTLIRILDNIFNRFIPKSLKSMNRKTLTKPKKICLVIAKFTTIVQSYISNMGRMMKTLGGNVSPCLRPLLDLKKPKDFPLILIEYHQQLIIL